MSAPVRHALFAASICGAFALPVHAQEAAPGPDSQWMLRGGFDVGRNHSRGFDASVDYTGRTGAMPEGDRYYDAGFAFSRSQSTVKSTATRPGAETRTGAGVGYVSYGSERWRGVLGMDAARDQDLRKSRRVSLGVDFARGGFAANLTGSHRKTTFDTFTFDPIIAERLGITLGGTHSVDCTISDKGLGARLGYGGNSWGMYASGNSYHYDKAKCSFDFDVPDVFKRLAAADFFDLAGRFLDRARARVGGRIGQEARLLKSEFGLGANFDLWIKWSVDYLRSQDAFGGATTSDYSVTGTFGLASNVSLDLTLGNTSGDGGSAQFVGLMLAVAM